MRIALVKIDTAAIELGRGIRRIEQMVDSGDLLWVFDLAATGRRRQLRFWQAELLAKAGGDGQAFNRLALADVVAQILPPRKQTYQAGELDQIFQIRHNTRLDLNGELHGTLAEGRNFYRRADLENFLSGRWIGGQTA